MKVRMTRNALKLRANVVVKVLHTQADALLTGLEPEGYNSGVLGWNWDVYNLGGGVCICTGYRPIGEEYNALVEYYNDRAKSALRIDDPITRAGRLERLRQEFVSDILGEE